MNDRQQYDQGEYRREENEGYGGYENGGEDASYEYGGPYDGCEGTQPSDAPWDENPGVPGYEERYEEPAAPVPPQGPAIISTNLTVNLICTLGAMSGLFGLFLCFADKRSQAVRRYAIQSAALLFVTVLGILICFVLGMLLGFVPLIGGIFRGIFNVLAFLLCAAGVVLRVRMMLHAYAGEAYVLPLIGEHARSFE